jgi:hypothetical protein
MNQPTGCRKVNKPYDESRYQRTFCGRERVVDAFDAEDWSFSPHSSYSEYPSSFPDYLPLPRSGILGRKILALVVTPLVNPPKHLAGAIPTFLMRGQSFKRPNWKKRRNVELYHFWQRVGSRT